MVKCDHFLHQADWKIHIPSFIVKLKLWEKAQIKDPKEINAKASDARLGVVDYNHFFLTLFSESSAIQLHLFLMEKRY